MITSEHCRWRNSRAYYILCVREVFSIFHSWYSVTSTQNPSPETNAKISKALPLCLWVSVCFKRVSSSGCSLKERSTSGAYCSSNVHWFQINACCLLLPPFMARRQSNSHTVLSLTCEMVVSLIRRRNGTTFHAPTSRCSFPSIPLAAPEQIFWESGKLWLEVTDSFLWEELSLQSLESHPIYFLLDMHARVTQHCLTVVACEDRKLWKGW